MYQNVACKNMATLQGVLDDQCRDRNYHMIWIEHDLMDPRTVSRKDMRAKVNEYMRTVMKAEPVDPTLLEFDDDEIACRQAPTKRKLKKQYSLNKKEKRK